MDTYLEQLLREQLTFVVATTIASPGMYSEKVDRLSLRDRSILLETNPVKALCKLLLTFALHPWSTASRLVKRLRSRLPGESVRRLLAGELAASSAEQLSAPLSRLKIIHAHSLALGFQFKEVSVRRGLPMVLTFHGLQPAGTPQTPLYQRRELFQHCCKVLVNTEYARHHAEALGCPSDKLVVIPQGLPLDDFPFAERVAPRDGEELTLLSVGRFHRDKGQRYSLLALARLKRLGIAAHWHFVGVGPDLRPLQKFAEKLGVSSCTTFHVALPVAELRALYRKCHVFVLSSIASADGTEHVETQGVVIQEAQASGCIPIATRTGGIPECIEDGHDGLLVHERSHRDLAKAILRLLSEGEAWSRYQRNGRHTVETRFSADVVGHRMASLLRALAGDDLRPQP